MENDLAEYSCKQPGLQQRTVIASGFAKARPAPVALFAFNRPDETARLLASLAQNFGAIETDLTVFCDGPSTPAEQGEVGRVQAIARGATGFKSVRVVVRKKNLGSAISIWTGLDQMFEERETVIVLEDDFTTSRYFLSFMNTALDFYKDEDRVVSICGYSPAGVNTAAETYLLAGAHCWGWGAWKRSWMEAEFDPQKALNKLVQHDLMYEFEMAGAEPCTLMLHHAIQVERESWVLPWMASAVLNNRLSLFPADSLVRFEGLRNSGLPDKWLRLLWSPMDDHCPAIRSIPLVADEFVMEYVRSNLMRLRCGDSRRQMLYNRLMKTLPEAVRRYLYIARVRRKILNRQC
jgi:hypothetical protein